MLSVNFHRVLTRCPCLVNTAIQQSCSLCPIRIFFTLWISLKFSWLKCWSLSGLFSPWLPNQSHRPGSGQPGSNSSSPQDPNCFCTATYAQSATTPLFIESILRMLGVNRTAGKTMKPCFRTNFPHTPPPSPEKTVLTSLPHLALIVDSHWWESNESFLPSFPREDRKNKNWKFSHNHSP